jgi:hypothetical protein
MPVDAIIYWNHIAIASDLSIVSKMACLELPLLKQF